MDVTPATDVKLVALLVTGDQQALKVCYDRHAGAMFGLARRVLADDHRAEEVVQEVFLRL